MSTSEVLNKRCGLHRKLGETHLMHFCTMKFESVPPRDARTRSQWQSRINVFLEGHQFPYPKSWIYIVQECR